MTQQAMIRGEVCFRAGEGMMVPIPPGPVEIEVADDSVTLHWTGENRTVGHLPGERAGHGDHPRRI